MTMLVFKNFFYYKPSFNECFQVNSE
uniref:Uncharacterized protein n=1 Tax=Anguilla anguilla TaxID=7936 RepID=A0A0E9Q2M8_ANGAN